MQTFPGGKLHWRLSLFETTQNVQSSKCPNCDNDKLFLGTLCLHSYLNMFFFFLLFMGWLVGHINGTITSTTRRESRHGNTLKMKPRIPWRHHRFQHHLVNTRQDNIWRIQEYRYLKFIWLKMYPYSKICLKVKQQWSVNKKAEGLMA